MGKRQQKSGRKNPGGKSASASSSSHNSDSCSNSNSNNKSIIEKLEMLRSFVGNTNTFSESDLSTCLRQSGFLVEVAAERLMTGQFQPTKKVKRTTISMTSPNHNNENYTSSDSPKPSPTTVTTTTPQPQKPKHHPTSGSSQTNTGSQESGDQKHTPVAAAAATLVTPKLTTPVVVTYHDKIFPLWKHRAWLLCQRWVSDGTNLTRNGSCRYQEEFEICNYSMEHYNHNNHNSSSSSSSSTSAAGRNNNLLRFRSTRNNNNNLQGSFPKHLAALLVPLLHANMIQLEASALMEEQQLPIGAYVPLCCTVWILHPQQFFATLLEEDSNNNNKKSAESFSKQFFAASSNSKKAPPPTTRLLSLREAALSLLEWAQHGQPLEDVIENYRINHSRNSSNNEDHNDDIDNDDLMVVDNDDTAPTEAEDDPMPEWAKDVIVTTEDTDNGEMDTPQGLNVELRPYQKQALYWMTQRENVDSDDNEWQGEQQSVLKELAQTSSSSSPSRRNADAALPMVNGKRLTISCDCGPVLVDTERVSAPSIGSLPASYFEEVQPQDPSVSGIEHKINNIHPIWERRFLCNASKTQAISFYVQPFFRKATTFPPPAPTPCRGGILADAMGLGKTVMLLALIQSSSMNQQDDPNPKDSRQSDTNHGTLVVTPLSLLLQWQAEIETKTSLSFRVHYGDSRKVTSNFNDVDIVLTTYGSLQGEYQWHRRNETVNSSQLLSKHWKRVILDECHFIKNPSTFAAKACAHLESERRWCVSGTIIQNSLDDVYSLMKFLRHEPWCESGFWKAAITSVSDMSLALNRVKRVLAPIMIRRTKETLSKDGKPILTLPEIDLKTVIVEFSPPERQFYEALYQKSFDIFSGFLKKGTASSSYFRIFSLIQRLRQACSHVALTVKSHIEEDEWKNSFGTTEEGSCEKKKSKMKSVTREDDAIIDQSFLADLHTKFKSMQKGESSSNESNRQYLSFMANKLNGAVMSQSTELNEECPICLEKIVLEDAVITPCLHVFCKDCLLDTLKYSEDNSKRAKKSLGSLASLSGKCPSCSDVVDAKKLLKLSQSRGKLIPHFLLESLNDVDTSYDASNSEEESDARNVLQNAVQGSSSAKMEAILRELELIWKEDKSSKVLIFSQFLGFLDVMEKEFGSHKIPFSRLDGKLSLKDRMSVIQEFGSATNSKKGSVLLISMKAGGVGLNLVSANTVFIADPWWNSAVEQQCIDRIHRIGQLAKRVRVRKFCVADSIEERILELQQRKKSIASAALRDTGNSSDKSNTSATRPSLDDFKLLFQELKCKSSRES